MATDGSSRESQSSQHHPDRDAPATVVDAVRATKQPPPETPAAISTRRWVVFSFWAVVLFLGLPIWWKTTTVYRATLPLQSMNDWADGKICRPVFPLRIALDTPSIPSQDTQHLLRATQHALDDLNDFPAHHLRLVLPEPFISRDAHNDRSNQDTALVVRLLLAEDGITPRATIQTHEAVLDILYSPNQLPQASTTSSPLATFIANELQALFQEEQAMLVYTLSSSSATHAAKLKSLSSETTIELARQSTRAFKYAPTYHLTFSLFTPTSSPSEWDIEAALAQYIQPLLQALSVISNFTVDTQVQLYATLSSSIRQPEFNADRNAWTLQKEDLSGFINAAEWPLSPSIGTGPTVNFALYIPSPDQSPLMVKENGGNSWLVPQWGGVVILNPEKALQAGSEAPKSLTKDDLRPAMLTFTSQLLSLFGLPESPASLPLRVSTLTRVRAASLLFSASSTLGALARLTQSLSSIAIPDSVAESVDLTIHHLQSSCNALHGGHFLSALDHARTAEVEAEKAFFERSMVGMVYFPDEHKVAVYLPLLGPVAVPLIMAALKEVKSFLQLRRKAA